MPKGIHFCCFTGLFDFRHSCASALISGAAPITAVSNFLGHSETTETLETYTHMFKKHLIE